MSQEVDTKPRKPGTWPKGVSGCPGGKPKSYREFVRACREHTPEALATIARLARGEPLVVTVEVEDEDTGETKRRKVVERVQSQTQLAASQYLIDRGWGKAVQPIEDREAGESVENLTDAELEAIIRDARVQAVEADPASLVERRDQGLLSGATEELGSEPAPVNRVKGK